MTPDHSYRLPQPPAGSNALDIHFCKTFLHQLQAAPQNHMPARISAAIEKTAALSGHTPEHVAKTLVEHGLRADRSCFPAAFVEGIEKTIHLPSWAAPLTPKARQELLGLWQQRLQPPASRQRLKRLR